MALDLIEFERKLIFGLEKGTPMSISCWLHNERELQRIKMDEVLHKMRILNFPVKVWTKEEVEANRSSAYKYVI